jgi:hypothetical protein
VYYYFTINTGQCAYVIISEATLPNNNLLNPVVPFVPATIRSMLSFSAYAIIPPTILELAITCVIISILFSLDLS